MVGAAIQPDEKTVSKVDFPEPAVSTQPETGSLERNGVCVDDLIHAAANGFAMIVRYLLRAGINPNDRDARGRTALQVAANGDIHDILVEAGAKSGSSGA
ncbi:MAG TPA: ankyrin repeat domain-containing protein [Acidobacteriota bacterium]|nr:ankyrin repeat domain-containing protein [Acidobacteriota bacterium]